MPVQNAVQTTKPKFSVAIKEEKMTKLINDTLGDKEVSRKFVAEITSVVANTPTLAKCTCSSIVAGALLAQSLNLPLAQSLGFAYLVPYKCRNGDTFEDRAQFQIGWKGIIQLAQRTNLYENIGVRQVHKGEWVGQDEFGEDVFKFSHEFDSQPIVGYFAYFKLTNGFKKTLYWTVAQCEAHATRYSKAHTGNSKGGEFDNWTKQFDQMAMKTVLKQLISKFGPMTTEITKVVEADQAVINENGKYDYVDNEKEDVVKPEAVQNEEDYDVVIPPLPDAKDFDD